MLELSFVLLRAAAWLAQDDPTSLQKESGLIPDVETGNENVVGIWNEHLTSRQTVAFLWGALAWGTSQQYVWAGSYKHRT